LRQAISIRLIIDKDELKGTTPIKQVIPVSGVGQFAISLKS